MAAFLPINGKLLGFGLTWATVANVKKESRESTAFSRAFQAEYRVRYAGRDIKYGMAKNVIDTFGAQPKGALLSAAVLFSNFVGSEVSSQNSLLVVQIDDTNAAIIALLNGEPYLDVVVTLSELDSQLIALNQEGHTTFTVYGNVPTFAAHNVTPADLLAGNTQRGVMTKFMDPRKQLQRIGMTMMVLVLIGGGGAWKAAEEKRAAEEAAKQVVDPVLEYKEATRKLLSQANFNGEAAYGAIWEVIKKREVNIAGWSLKKISCKPTLCDELWQQGNGSFHILSEHIQPPQTIKLQPNRETSLITYPLMGKKTVLTQATLPKREALWIDLVTQQQHLKRISPTLAFTPKPAEIVGLSSTGLASDIPVGLQVYSGEMIVSAPVGLAAEILQHHLSNVMVSEVSVETFDDIRNATIQIKGTYYAQH